MPGSGVGCSSDIGYQMVGCTLAVLYQIANTPGYHLGYTLVILAHSTGWDIRVVIQRQINGESQVA